ncbi:MAG: hypothetical protein AAF318_14135 [Pseudomonadota bacterium]
MKAPIAAVLGALLVAGCQTSDTAMTSLDSFVGQSTDAFFARHGAPRTQFALDNGGMTYTWVGGHRVVRVPDLSQRKTTPAATSPSGFSRQTTNTKVSVSNPSPGTTVTRTTSTSASVNFNPTALFDAPEPEPERTVVQQCELQIAADADGIIQSVTVRRDTQGDLPWRSRCSDLFGA